MPATSLTGSRIRERRLDLGVRQSDLAKKVNISASYLNLIEHNRRRIGGKLLLDIAEVLAVSLTALSQGAQGALVTSLREAAASQPEAQAELARAEDFAGRLPGWAALVASQQARIAELERMVSGLSDRLTHDPYLSTSMHEVLSTVTAIRSTAAILAETHDIDPDWQRRFQSNLFEESKRLVEASQSLVTYLDVDEVSQDLGAQTPQDEFEAFLVQHDYHFEGLESGGVGPDIESLLEAAPSLISASGRMMAENYLVRYAKDAADLPLQAVLPLMATLGRNPASLASALGVPLDLVLRRLTTLPSSANMAGVGMVIADGSGTFVFRRPIEGFALPRFGAACPLWPLFQALAQPLRPIHARVRQMGRGNVAFDAYAIAMPVGAQTFEGPHLFEAMMMLVPVIDPDEEGIETLLLGPTCRVCPKQSCAARRERSILADGI